MKEKEKSEKAGLKLNIQKTKIMASSPITWWQIDGETMETLTYFLFLGLKITADGDCSHDVKRHLFLGRKAMVNLESILKSRDILCWQRLSSQSYGFFSSRIWMWELDHKESWAPKNWCFWTVLLEKTLESPLDSREIKPINPKGNQPWIFIGRTVAEAPILWLPDVKNWLIGKDLDDEKDWKQEKRITEGKMVGWHHWLVGHEFEQVPGVGNGQGSLECCRPWGCKVLNTTEWLSWTLTELNFALWVRYMNLCQYWMSWQWISAIPELILRLERDGHGSLSWPGLIPSLTTGFLS